MRFGQRRRQLDPAEIAFNAAQRAKRAADVMHCQCCRRDILANNGYIAHHGYERPDHGWQTASCMGAKRLPLEADRKALGEMIGFLRNRLTHAIAHRNNIESERAPIVFTYHVPFIGPVRWYRFDVRSWARAKWPTVEQRFNVTRKTFAEFRKLSGNDINYRDDDFDGYCLRHLAGLDRSIEALTNHINEEQKVYDGWKQTHERRGKGRDGEWIKLGEG